MSSEHERGISRREEFGALETTRSSETAITAAAAQARSQVEAMYVMALQRPRDMMAVRERLLNECERRGFAEAAEYSLPRGNKQITGPSIRFAEAALRALRNIHVRTTVLYDDAERRVGEVTVIDLEANVPLSAAFTVEKTIERRKVTNKDVILRERINSTGEKLFIILASEADVLMKQESIVARMRRNLILQLLPGDLKDEALAQCYATMKREDSKDPAAAAKWVSDKGHALGISTSQLREYIGRPVDQVTPDEARELRAVFSSIKDGATTWAEVIEARRGEKAPAPTPAEQSEKAKLIAEIASARIRDKARHDAALAAVGVNQSIRLETLAAETLHRIVHALLDEEPAPEAESPPAEEVEELESTRDWLDGKES